MPGFVDAHIHIESSMLVPDEFARVALTHGTLASVSDPHEIANVLGLDGVRYMHHRASLTPFRILLGAPSCVPATCFESSGATLAAEDIDHLFETGVAGYLSEVMNYPGVLNADPSVMAKIAVARRRGVPLDGHAPGLTGDEAKRYAQAGISTDHECTTLAEALDKLAAGMSILIREGSAARDFEALHPLLDRAPDRVMFCSDDRHPDDLLEGHIRDLVRRSLALGYPRMAVLRAATLNPVRHYRLALGLLQPGDPFDAILVDDLVQFELRSAWIEGERVVERGLCRLPRHPVERINRFEAQPLNQDDFRLAHPGGPLRVIVAQEGSLLTRETVVSVPEAGGQVVPDPSQDVLLLAVVNRYASARPAMALIRGFGLQQGALASSVSHDSHNIVAVGTSAAWLARAVNAVIADRGGLAVVDAQGVATLPLPVAGLMSDQPATEVGPRYQALNEKARAMGSPLRAPFMTLSFMALLVIPELKLSDRGLFDGRTFSFCDLAVGAGT